MDVAGSPESASPADTRVLFRSEDFLVKAVETGRRDVAFITFDSYTDARTLDRAGFGEHFFQARGIPAAHVISRENRWYQQPAMADVIAALARWAAGFERVVAYGSSMGGFAALQYGAACGARTALALSPQYSVDPALVPFEDRWPTDVARIRFQPMAANPRLAIQYLLYDPRDPYDARHAALFAERSPTVAIRAPFGGHPVGAFVNEAGLLESLLDRIARDTLDAGDVPALEQTLRAGRRRSGQYLFTLGQSVPDHRPAQKLALARMAAEAQPEDPVYLSFYAGMLDEHGRHEEAYPVHVAARALPTAGPHTDWRLLMHHRMQGAFAEAERLGLALAEAHPDATLFQLTLEGVLREKRRESGLGRLATRLGLEPAVDYLARRLRRAWRRARS